MKLKKQDPELTLDSTVGLLQESGHTPGRHRTAGCTQRTNPLSREGARLEVIALSVASVRA